MQDQLSLFSQDKTAAEERQSSFKWSSGNELTAVDELLAIAGHCRTQRQYAELMGCLIRFPQYSIFNALLLFLQNPRVSRVATAGSWARRCNRYPRPGARPLIILAPTAPVLFLYDVSETEGPPLGIDSDPPSPHRTTPLREIFERTQANCGLHGISLRQTETKDPQAVETVVRLTAATRKRYQALDLNPKASYLVILDQRAALSDRYRNLARGLGQIFCGHYGIDARAWWPEREALSDQTEEIEAGSVARAISGRLGLDGGGENWTSGGQGFLPPFSLNAVIQAASYIEEMGRHRWSAPKKKSRYKT